MGRYLRTNPACLQTGPHHRLEQLLMSAVIPQMVLLYAHNT